MQAQEAVTTTINIRHVSSSNAFISTLVHVFAIQYL